MASPRGVVVCEFITGGGLAASALPESLAREGELMVRAVVDGLSAMAGVEVTVARDHRLPPLAAVRNVRIAADPWRRWAELMAAAWRVIAIAPESEGLLERLLTLAGARAVGASREAVRVAASKYRTARALAAAGIPVVPTWRAGRPMRGLAGSGEWVLKPDDGAGCEGALRGRGGEALARALAVDRDRYVVQPWVEGDALSATAVVHRGTPSLLACSRQEVVCERGALRLAALTVNGAREHAPALARLVAAVVRAIPGLEGPVGIDCVVDRGVLRVLEVNPRLTSTWAGLAASLGLNPVPALLSATAAREAAAAATTSRPVRIGLAPAAAA